MVAALSAIGFGAAMGVAIAAPVGPVAALCIERTFARGLAIALVTALGAGLADAAFGAVAAFGVGSVTAWVRAHEVHLRLVGAALLTGLAVNAWRKRRALAFRAEPQASGGALAAALGSGFLLTASSPVTIVTFAVALASFGAGVTATPTWVPVGVLVGSGGWYAALSLGAHVLRERVRTRMDRVGAASALFLAGCALFSIVLAARALAG